MKRCVLLALLTVSAGLASARPRGYATASSKASPGMAPPSDSNCALCEVVVTEVAKFGGNGTSIADAILALDKGCDALFGHGKKGANGTLDVLCRDMAKAAVGVFPFGVKQFRTLAWDALAGCAALGECRVPCCEPSLPQAPEQVHIALTGAAGEMVASWTTLGQTATHTVQWGQTSNHTASWATSLDGAADTYTHFGWEGELHRATMTGLAPGTRYHYRVGDAVGGWSRVWSFSTLPAGAGTDAAPLRLASIGDMGYGNNSDGTVKQLTALVDAGAIDAVLHNGDISYADGDMRHWDVYMRKIEPIAARVPYLVTPGNHEFWFNFSAFKKRFAMPVVGGHQPDGDDNAMYWSADVGANLHLAAMNTESVVDTAAMTAAQLEWLAADLAAAAAARAHHRRERGALATADGQPQKHVGWTIAFGHRPLYCSNKGGTAPRDNRVLQAKAESILNEGAVDLVLQAHVHDYERTLPVRHGVPTSTNYTSPTAPVYIVNGAAGSRESNENVPHNMPWSPPPRPGAMPYMHDISFGVITVATSSLRHQMFFSANGTAFDDFTITK